VEKILFEYRSGDYQEWAGMGESAERRDMCGKDHNAMRVSITCLEKKKGPLLRSVSSFF
jgi:hypothetical protein